MIGVGFVARNYHGIIFIAGFLSPLNSTLVFYSCLFNGVLNAALSGGGGGDKYKGAGAYSPGK